MDEHIYSGAARSFVPSAPFPVRFEDTRVRLRKVSAGRCVVGIDIDLAFDRAQSGEAAPPEVNLDAGSIDALRDAGATTPQAAPAAPHPSAGRWRFDRKKFFHNYRLAFGRLNQKQVDGLNALLAAVEADTKVADIRWLAYMFATVRHECAGTWRPIEEYGKGAGRPYGRPVVVVDSHGKRYRNVYYGRGYVQLTWKQNYAKMGKLLKNRLLYTPALALQPSVAYRIMSLGMRLGTFTGKKLADYIHGGKADYVNARRIINGLDRAQTIAQYATRFERILRRSAIARQARA